MHGALKKAIGYTTLSIAVICTAGYLYIFRQQQIDVGLIPNEFSYCGRQIYGADPDYKEIVSWLKANKDGWVTSYASFAPLHTYQANAFKVYVFPEAVVVSYKNDYGYPQFIKSGKHQLAVQCPASS